MKRSVLLTCLLALSWSVGTAPAQVQDQQQPAEPRGFQAEIEAGQTQIQIQAGDQQAQQSGPYLTQRELQNLELRNAADEEMGQVSDVLINLQSGQIMFAGIESEQLAENNRLIAVPWQTINVQRQEDDYQASLNADSNMLQNAPTFSSDSWSAAADQQFLGQFTQHYSLEGQRIERAFRPSEGQQQISAVPSEQLAGMNVVTTDGEEVGEVGDLVIDAGMGEVVFVTVEAGGFLGVGEKARVVSLQNLTLQQGDDEPQLVLATSREEFRQLPFIENEENMTKPELIERVRAHFQNQTGAGTQGQDQQQIENQQQPQQSVPQSNTNSGRQD